MRKHIFRKNVPSGTPADMLKPGTTEFVFSPEVIGEARNVLFAFVELTQEALFKKPEFREYFSRISSEAAGEFRFDLHDFAINGALFPTRPLDALRLGVAMYDEKEDVTQAFMEARILEILDRGAQVQAEFKSQMKQDGGIFAFGKKRKAKKLAYDFATVFMAKEHRIICNFKKLALQEGGVPNSGVPDGQTLLAFSNRDPRNPNRNTAN